MAAEQIRRVLLAQTGITSWFPRWSLPGAAPSHPQCFDTEPRVAEPAVTAPAMPEIPPGPETLPHEQGSEAPRPATRSIRDLMPPAEESKPRLAVPEVAPAPVSQPQAPAAAKPAAVVDIPDPFAFSWFAVDRRLAVLTVLPPGSARLSGSCRQMLGRLVAALHPSLQSVGLNEQSFHWPFVDAPDLPADRAAARQAADAFMARRLREQNAAMVVVLADDVPWFLSQGGEPAPVGSLAVHPRFGFAMLCTHSLHAMEQNPGLKREAWQALQLVRDRLARNAGS